MDTNNGKPLSPWKVPSHISLKRIRHKMNSDLSVQTSSSSIDKNASKSNGKRNRLMINKFALARSISTPTSNDNLLSIDQSLISDNDEHLLARLHHIMPPPAPPSSLSIANDLHFNSTMKTFSFDQTFNNTESSQLFDEVVCSYPIDWSLKCSCRFYSVNPSSLITSLMKLRSTDESLALDYISSSTLPDNDKAYFRSLTSYWTYPHLPWLRLFPRSQQQQTNGNCSALDEQAQLALQDEWKLSFQSLFQAFRSKYCSYFYLCSHTFNILFREDSLSQIIAIVNPTTGGLRLTLEREGIEFTMADGGDVLNNSTNKTTNENETEEDENVDENDETCAQWLEEMGFSSTSTNTNNERRPFLSKKNVANEKLRSTTILIRDLSSVNSLFNFLLNKCQRICVPLTGSLTGIPPTLISPRFFLYSTLKYLNVQFQSNSMVTINDGPLLPDRLKHLWNLFKDKNEQIQMTCTHLERTSAFNFDQQLSRTIKQIQIDDNIQLRVQFAQI